MMKGRNGQALIAAVVIMVMLALFTTIGVSLLGTQAGHSGAGLAESTQGFCLAHGGLEWYMQQLNSDSDWSDNSAPATQTVGSGTFTITLSNETQDTIDVVSTGAVVGPDARNRERFISATVERAPFLPEYAVFWGNDNGDLTFADGSGGTDVTGDMWSAGSASIGSNSGVTGTTYHASGESITGAGSYTTDEFAPSVPTIPLFDDTSWETLMSSWNTLIDNAGASVSSTSRSEGSGTFDLSSDTDFGSLPQPVSYRTINTNGYNIIRGTGSSFTVNCRNFNLQTGSEIESDVPAFDINCRREFTMTDSQINADGYTIDCRDFIMNGTSQINSQSNTINSNRDIEMNDTSQITNSETLNTTGDFTMNNSAQIIADSITINCLDVFAMNNSAQITSDSWTINVNDDFQMNGSSSISSDDFQINIADQFDTDGTTSVTGYGYIVCSDSGNISLHHESGDAGTFTATPSGGTLYFLSGDDFTVNSNQSDTTVTLNADCVLYSRNPSGNNDLLRIRNDNTTIDDAEIIAERRIIIEDSADITNSFIFVDRAGGNTNNLLQITDSGTTVSGTVISMGRGRPSLSVNNGATVNGFVYQHDGVGDRGRAEFDGGSTINGALYVYEFDGTSFGPGSVVYNSGNFPATWPAAFPERTKVQSGTWDGL